MRHRLDSIGRSLYPHLPALGIFTILSLILTWPLFRDPRHVLYSWGDPVFQAWTLAWNWHAITTDPTGIFDANIFYPWHNTLAYSDHLFGQTLLVLPALALTGEGILANNLAVLLAFILSGFMMYLLVYDLTGSRAAGILAGVAYAFAPPRMAHLEHLHLLSMQWPPLILLCLRRMTLTTGKPRLWWGAGLGAAFFIQGLSGIYVLYFTVVMLILAGAVYVAFAMLERNRQLLSSILLAAAACAVAGVLLVPTLLPYLQVNEELRFEREVAEVSFWSAKRSDWLAASPDNRLWNQPTADNFRHIEQALFPGLALVLLALVGLTYPGFRREKWVLLAIVIGAIILSFGLTGWILGRETALPYRLFYDWLPGFKAIRVPARFGLLALVGLGGLAGLGVARIWQLARPRIPSKFHLWSGISLFALGLAIFTLESISIIDLPEPLPVEDVPPYYAWMDENPAPTIELPMGEGEVASAWPNFWSMMHWNDVVNGYSGLVPPTYLEMRERMRAFPADGTIELLQGIGVETVLIHEDYDEAARPEVEAALQSDPRLTLELSGDDAIYSLAPDPWIWRMVDTIPSGERVDLPNVSPDTLTFGYFVAILQRQGHPVSGNGSIAYLELERDEPACYAILHADDDPADHGYANATVVMQEHDYILYRAEGCD